MFFKRYKKLIKELELDIADVKHKWRIIWEAESDYYTLKEDCETLKTNVSRINERLDEQELMLKNIIQSQQLLIDSLQIAQENKE